MIELRVDGEIQADAVGIEPAHDVVELLARTLRLVHPDEGFCQNGALEEEGERVFVEHRIVDALAELAGAVKIHRLDVEPGQGQAAQGDGRAVCVLFRQRQRRDGLSLQPPPFAEMEQRGRFQHVEQDENVDVTDLLRQLLALRFPKRLHS